MFFGKAEKFSENGVQIGFLKEFLSMWVSYFVQNCNQIKRIVHKSELVYEELKLKTRMTQIVSGRIKLEWSWLKL